MSATAESNAELSDVESAFHKVSRESLNQKRYVMLKGNGFVHSALTSVISNKYHFQGCQRLRGGKYVAITANNPNTSQLLIAELDTPNIGAPLKPGNHNVVLCIGLDPGVRHTSGIQSVGDILAVGMDEDGDSIIQFFDVSNPIRLQELRHLRIVRSFRTGTTNENIPLKFTNEKKGEPNAAAVGVTRLHDNHFLLVVGRTESQIVDFYFSSLTQLTDPKCSFEYKFSWCREIHKVGTTIDDVNYGKYQTLNIFIQEGQSANSNQGTIYLIGMHNTVGLALLNGRDFADLYKVTYDATKQPEPSVFFTKIAKKHVTAKCSNFNAGAGVYIDENRNMHFYSVPHRAVPEGHIPLEEFY